MTLKRQRHRKILEIINNETVERQEDIAKRLNEEGIKVTQATVSRDIHELRLIKQTDANGVQHYIQTVNIVDEDFNEKLSEIFSNCVVNVDYAKNIVVIKTLSGMAQAAAAAIDALHSRYIVGCIAGDDTVFIVLRTDEDAVIMSEKLDKMRR